MGGKGGKGKNRKRKHGGKGKGDKGDGPEDRGDDVEPKRARNDIWQEDGVFDLTNEAYETYYSKQKVCSEEEFPALLQHLRTGLPVAIRVNRMRTGASSLCSRLAELQAACSKEEGRELYAPQPLTWYSHNLAWQWLGLERRTIKKDKTNKALKEFLFTRECSGLISRQEAVSMVPPLFLGVESHHLVLDLCAAPGSKTSQMIEFMHWANCADGAGPPTGLVVANELQWKRSNMLAHQVQRLGSPCAAVVNMDAQYFPDLWFTENGSQQQLRYDRVLCDVPCSGDGTMRKTPYIWRSWTVKDGLSLHIRQLGILNRGLDVLKVGGRVVYSTCSLNPMEDEAVVAAALARHGGSVVLVPPPDLPGFKAAKGLTHWLVPNPNDNDCKELFDDYETLPQEHKEGKCKLLPSMFPPKGNDEILNSVRDHCRRMLPHLMDTGGFFVAILEKRAELKLSARARREQAYQARKSQASSEAAGSADAAASADASADKEQAEPAADAAASLPEEELSAAAAVPPPNMRKITKEYVTVNEKVWQELQSFYGFDASVAKQFAMRVEGDRRDKVFLMSEGLHRFLNSETKMPCRMVLCGVAAFQESTSYHERASQWTPLQQGVLALVALGMRRRVTACSAMIARLLREKELSIAELREAASKGELKGLEALADAGASAEGSLRPGSLAVVLNTEEDPKRAPFAVLATLTDSMLELAVGNAAEVASLLEDLEGQPPIETLLKAGEAADAMSDGADGDVEAGDAAEDAVTDADMDIVKPQNAAPADAVQSGQCKSATETDAPADRGADADVEATGGETPGDTSSAVDH